MRAARSCFDSPKMRAIRELTEAINRLAADRSKAARLGDAGYERARLVTWDGVIERLLAW